jgi:hypothetical protein
MNMVDLIVTVCSLLNPNACQDRHMLIQSQGSLKACVMQAEPYLAQWAGEHPGLRIVRWRCDWPDAEKQSL